MKSAYELAMERLEAKDPGVLLNEEQKQRIAEIETKCKADVAAKELLLHGEIAKAEAAGQFEEVEKLRRQLADEIRRINDKRDSEKAAVRASN